MEKLFEFVTTRSFKNISPPVKYFTRSGVGIGDIKRVRRDRILIHNRFFHEKLIGLLPVVSNESVPISGLERYGLHNIRFLVNQKYDDHAGYNTSIVPSVRKEMYESEMTYGLLIFALRVICDYSWTDVDPYIADAVFKDILPSIIEQAFLKFDVQHRQLLESETDNTSTKYSLWRYE